MSMTESERLTYYSMRGSENDGWYLKPGVAWEDARERLAMYEDIGTVSEFRELKEKATAKKIVVKGVMGFDGEESFCCPNCGLDISQWGYGVCIDCGQKLLY